MATFCGVLQKEILVASCPLSKGVCLWKHRETGVCAYTSEDLSVEGFCERVGLKVPTPSDVVEIRNKILNALRT